jgi:hypothetical protein
VEALRNHRGLLRREVAARVSAVVAPAVGLLAYLAWAAGRDHGFWYPLRVQEDAARRGGWRFPLTNLLDQARDFASGDEMSAGLHVATAVVMLVLLVVLARRWPVSYTAYAAVAAVVALSASNLDSLERYALSTVPFVLAAADLGDGAGREEAIVAASAAGLVALSVLAFTGVLVP